MKKVRDQQYTRSMLCCVCANTASPPHSGRYNDQHQHGARDGLMELPPRATRYQARFAVLYGSEVFAIICVCGIKGRLRHTAAYDHDPGAIRARIHTRKTYFLGGRYHSCDEQKKERQFVPPPTCKYWIFAGLLYLA